MTTNQKAAGSSPAERATKSPATRIPEFRFRALLIEEASKVEPALV
jgi:hypothetical protein